MEVWLAVFRNLYTGFLLRDFCGKIVPGLLFLFSIATLFRSPRELFEYLTKEIPTATLVFLAGIAWITTLGTQSLAEGMRIWSYFPDEVQTTVPQPQSKIGIWANVLTRGDDSIFDRDTLLIDEFQFKASEHEKQQYERFVLIKEACGNLFMAILLSLPALVVGMVSRSSVFTQKWSQMGSRVKFMPSPVVGTGCIYLVLVMVGLHRMHAQHVHRQF